MRKFVVGAAAIVAFGALAVFLILALPAGEGSPSVAEQPATPAPPPNLGSQGLPPLPVPGIVGAPPMVEYLPAPPPAPPGSWEAVTPVARLAALGPPGAALGRELNELQPDLAACFDEVVQSRQGRQRPSATVDARDGTGAGPAVLMLLLEMAQDEVRIVDAPVDSRGGASDGLIVCAQKVLRGRVVQAPGALPGQRARAMFTLVQ